MRSSGVQAGRIGESQDAVDEMAPRIRALQQGAGRKGGKSLELSLGVA